MSDSVAAAPREADTNVDLSWMTAAPDPDDFSRYTPSERRGQERDLRIHDQVTLSDGSRVIFARTATYFRVSLGTSDTSVTLREGELPSFMANALVGYVWAEVGGVVVLIYRYGSDPTYVDLFDKRTGKLLQRGVDPFLADTARGEIMFEMYFADDGYLAHYDTDARSTSLLKMPANTDCFVGDCWSAKHISEHVTEIRYQSRQGRDTAVLFRH